MLDQEIEVVLKKYPKLTVRELATQFGMKVRTFYRHWKDEGTTPKELLEKKRVEMAKQQLLTNFNKKIADIARDLGFCDHYYFSKWFRQRVGVPPQKYRMMTLKERVALETKRRRPR